MVKCTYMQYVTKRYMDTSILPCSVKHLYHLTVLLGKMSIIEHATVITFAHQSISVDVM